MKPDLITDPKSIAQQTGQSIEWVDSMIIDRQGMCDHATMQTVGMHRLTHNHKAYRIHQQRGLIEQPCDDTTLDLETYARHHQHDTPPIHNEFAASWGERSVDQDSHANVFGDSVCLEVNSHLHELAIPIIEATADAVLYYGAVLVKHDQVVRFPNLDCPVWEMAYGENYLHGYLMTENGKGAYLEWHADRPHWHQPMDSNAGGHYVLGKKIITQDGVEAYHVTGFTIPFGCALYSKMGAIHCDASLTGRYWVGYADTQSFSTGLIRTRDNTPVGIRHNKKE